jgi:hypothetical protein
VSITGSIGAGALTDLNANGATLTDDGSSIYTALIHDSPVHTLLDPSQSFSALADPFGMPSTAAIGKVSFGPELLAQSANNTISEKIQFTLTAGDRVILPTVFAVTAVPEPGMLILLASGLACLVTFSRRYSALAARSRGR